MTTETTTMTYKPHPTVTYTCAAPMTSDDDIAAAQAKATLIIDGREAAARSLIEAARGSEAFIGNVLLCGGNVDAALADVERLVFDGSTISAARAQVLREIVPVRP